MEDTIRIPMNDKTDDLCVAEFAEIVPLDRAVVEVKQEDLSDAEMGADYENNTEAPNNSNIYCEQDFICPVFIAKEEELQDVKVEVAVENDTEDPNNSGFYCTPDFICPLVEVKCEDVEDAEVDIADESDVSGPNNTVKVRVLHIL